jgi:thiosulfate/3-mercaptopyruvate sulfurtransferase
MFRICSRSFAPVIKNPLLTVSDAKALAEFGQRIRFVDASWHLAGTRDAEEEFENKRIHGAIRFDIDTVKDRDSRYPHMLPPPEIMQDYVDRHGLVLSSDVICVYTQANCFSAARGWWTFSAYGFTSAILQGGIEAWEEAKLPIETGSYQEPLVLPPHATEKVSLRTDLVRDMDQLLAVVKSGVGSDGGLIVDARSHGRWLGTEAELRQGVACGRIPGSLNLPFRNLFEDDDMTRFKTVDELRKIFQEHAIDISSSGPIVTTCGSGVTAAAVSFALHLCGRKIETVPVYDGSWAEWGSIPHTPKVSGEPDGRL